MSQSATSKKKGGKTGALTVLSRRAVPSYSLARRVLRRAGSPFRNDRKRERSSRLTPAVPGVLFSSIPRPHALHNYYFANRLSRADGPPRAAGTAYAYALARTEPTTNKNLAYDVLQLGASGASTLKRGTRGSLPQTAHGPAAEASSSAASSSSVVGGGGGDGS